MEQASPSSTAAAPTFTKGMTATASRVDRYGCSWVNLTDGSIHGERPGRPMCPQGDPADPKNAEAWRRYDAEDLAFHESWARVVGYESRVADYTKYDYYQVEIIPLPWTNKWAVRFAVPNYDGGGTDREYLGYPENTHIKLFDTWEEARDRMRACGFSFARMSVVMPIHLAARLVAKENS